MERPDGKLKQYLCSYRFGCAGAIELFELCHRIRRGRKPALILNFEEECANFIRQVWLCLSRCGHKVLTRTFNNEPWNIICQLHRYRVY